jgi:hypothetical protein
VFASKLGKKNFINPKAWMLDFLSRSSAADLTVLAVAFGFLWEHKNGTRNGELTKHLRALAEQIKTYVHMIESHLRKPASNHKCKSTSSEAIWTPQPEGTVWINVDATLFKSSNKMGVDVGVHWLSLRRRVTTGSCWLVFQW